MNTIFHKWGAKNILPKTIRLLKLSFDDSKTFWYLQLCYFCPIRRTYSSPKIFCKHVQGPLPKVLPQKIKAARTFCISRNRCWNCPAIVIDSDLVCMSCGSVQEPKQTLNYFEIFKKSPHFDIDVRNLTVKFRRLQNLLHPDKIASRSEKEKAYSAEQSAKVNKAYQTLLRPMERGLYLLELHSMSLREDEIQLPSEFLSSIMETNETIEVCRSPDALETIRHVNDAKLQMLFSDVSLAFKEKNINKARESLLKLKYFINIDNKIKKLEDELGISRDD